MRDFNREQILKAIKEYAIGLDDLSDKYHNDYEIVKFLVNRNGHDLEFASKELQDNYEIVMTAVQSTSFALKYASEKLRADREVVITALKCDGFGFEYVSKELRNDPDIIMSAIEGKYFPTSKINNKLFNILTNNQEFMLKAISKDGFNLAWASERLQNDREIVITAIKNNNRRILANVSYELRNDRDIVLMAIKKSGLELKYTSDRFRNDLEIVKLAVENNERAIQYATTDVQQKLGFPIFKIWKSIVRETFLQFIPLSHKLHTICNDKLNIINNEFYTAHKEYLNKKIDNDDLINFIKKLRHHSNIKQNQKEFIFSPRTIQKLFNDNKLPIELYHNIIEQSDFLSFAFNDNRSYYLDKNAINFFKNSDGSLKEDRVLSNGSIEIRTFSHDNKIYAILHGHDVNGNGFEDLFTRNFTPDKTGKTEEELLNLVKEIAQYSYEILPINLNNAMKKILSSNNIEDGLEFICFNNPEGSNFDDTLQKFYECIDDICDEEGINDIELSDWIVNLETDETDNNAQEYEVLINAKYKYNSCQFVLKFTSYKVSGNISQIKSKWEIISVSGYDSQEELKNIVDVMWEFLEFNDHINLPLSFDISSLIFNANIGTNH